MRAFQERELKAKLRGLFPNTKLIFDFQDSPAGPYGSAEVLFPVGKIAVPLTFKLKNYWSLQTFEGRSVMIYNDATIWREVALVLAAETTKAESEKPAQYLLTKVIRNTFKTT